MVTASSFSLDWRGILLSVGSVGEDWPNKVRDEVSSELNKIFGRDFLIAFFVPALFFLLGTFFLLGLFSVDTPLSHLNWRRPLEDTSFLVIVALIFAIFLQAVNREIFRMAEGYWPERLRRRLNGFHRSRFRKLTDKVNELYNQEGEIDEQKFNALSLRAAMKYPSTEAQVLPTSFGNAVRAYEDYPRAIYGFESINGWSRLQALISPEFRDVLSQDRARVDLWLNLSFLACVFGLELAIFASYFGRYSSLWIELPLLFLIWFAYVRARSSVQEYGDQVKAAFDVYLPALAITLGYTLSSDVDKNRKFWSAFSEVMIYRDEAALRDMANSGLKTIPNSEEAGEDLTTGLGSSLYCACLMTTRP